MSEILSIDKLKEMAQPIIEIPDFDNIGKIKVRVQKPKILSMAEQGKIPNHLMNIAVTKLTGKGTNSKKEPSPEEKMKQVVDAIDLYCSICLVEPSYDEFKPIMTDDQKFAIFNWAIGEVSTLDSFRSNGEDGTNNSNGEEVSEEA